TRFSRDWSSDVCSSYLQTLLERAVFYPEFLGIPWYRESDYAEIRRVMIDGDSLPPTYFEWFRNAVQLEKSQQDNGVKVVRVMLHIVRSSCMERVLSTLR